MPIPRAPVNQSHSAVNASERCHGTPLLFLAVVLLLSAQVRAAEVCIFGGNSAALAFWLDNYEDNGQNDEIRLESGFYDVPTGGFLFDSSEARSLSITGGWNEGCTTLRGSSGTILDGGGTDRVMRLLNRNGDLTIQGITFTGGLVISDTSGSAGLYVNGITNSGANVTIERNTFSNNAINGGGGGAALSAHTDGGILRVRNNLFFGNDGGNVGAAFVTINGGTSSAFITSNTVVGNGAFSSVAGGFRLAFGGGAPAGSVIASNNIFWANVAGDLQFSGGVVLYNNDIEDLFGTPDPASTNNISLAPQFEIGTYRPTSFSPLVNAGIDAAPGGLATTDLFGSSRIQGGSVDIGAYETSVLFADDFE